MELRKLRISYLAEQFARQILAENYNVASESIRHLTEEDDQAPYDLEFNGIRFDVKYSAPTNMASNDNTKVWDFSLRGKAKGSCDFFVLIGSKVGVFDSVFLVPESDAPTHHLRIPLSAKSKWMKYKIWRPVATLIEPAPTKHVSPKHATVAPINKKVSASAAATKALRDREDAKLALEIFAIEGKASTSLLQRRMSIGYGRAARIMDLLRGEGHVSDNDGNRASDLTQGF